MQNELFLQAQTATAELLAQARLSAGDLMVVGCSSSEIAGGVIGQNSSEEAARSVLAGILSVLKENGIFLAAQCCEHLNRALIVETAYAKIAGLPIVNAVPQKKAGGSFAAAAYAAFEQPAAVEHVKAQAGLDIGDTFIGMHLDEVAVPVRLQISHIGGAHLTAARVRPKYIGGARAVYDPALL